MKDCKYCGLAGLEWVRIDGKFRLKDPKTGALHACLKAGHPRDHSRATSTPAATSLSALADRYPASVLTPLLPADLQAFINEVEAPEPTLTEPSILEGLLAKLV